MSDSRPHHPQSEPPTLGEHNGYPIYPMPAFVALTASDLEATVAFFTEALDFDVMFSGPEVNGTPMLVHLRRARYQDILVRQGAARAASNALTVGFAATDAASVDALQARVERAGGRVATAAADTPWNTHELTVADPDGNLFTFTARAAQPQARTFEETKGRPIGHTDCSDSHKVTVFRVPTDAHDDQAFDGRGCRHLPDLRHLPPPLWEPGKPPVSVDR